MSIDGNKPPHTVPPRRSWSDLGPRIASAAVLITLVVTGLYVGSYLFAAVVAIAFALAYREWETMVTRQPISPVGWVLIAIVCLSGFAFAAFGLPGAIGTIAIASLIAVVVGGEAAPWRVAGLVTYGAIILAALLLRGDSSAGIWAGVYLGTVVWMTDSAAFFAGRQIGGEKLAPGISPSKTWSGALGGLTLGTGAGLVVWILASDAPWWFGLVLSAIISILGQLGDLGESAIKRHFRIKDSGDIIPGHGGLMDRLDSLTFGVLLVLVIGATHGGLDAVAEGLLFW